MESEAVESQSDDVPGVVETALGVETPPDVERDPDVVITLGDEAPDEAQEQEQPAPAWVKKVRQRNRELERELRELRKQTVSQAATPEPVGPKPTLQDSDYDTEKYEQALTTWYDSKRKADEQAAKAAQEAEAATKAWNDRLADYSVAKTKLGVPDFDDAESVVMEAFNTTQQGIIVHGAANAAVLMYALGKNEAKAKELAAIKDPIKFAFAVAKLEGQVKMTPKKPTAQPESRIISTGRSSGAIDQTLDRLRAEAAKSGDYSKVIAYKRTKRGQA